jgi:hypothetical protein
MYDSKYYLILQKANFTYKQSDCFELCFSDYAFKQCGCRDGSTINFFSEPICKTVLQIKCMVDFTKIFYEQNHKDCNCPLECHAVSYKFATSLSEFPSYKYAAFYTKKAYFTHKDTMINRVRYSMLSLNIYYDDLSYTVIKEKKKIEWVDMLASIGGLVFIYFISCLYFPI